MQQSQVKTPAILLWNIVLKHHFLYYLLLKSYKN